MSFNSAKGDGTFEEIIMENGKGKRVTGKITKSGKRYNEKITNIEEPRTRLIPVPAFFF